MLRRILGSPSSPRLDQEQAVVEEAGERCPLPIIPSLLCKCPPLAHAVARREYLARDRCTVFHRHDVRSATLLLAQHTDAQLRKLAPYRDADGLDGARLSTLHDNFTDQVEHDRIIDRCLPRAIDRVP